MYRVEPDTKKLVALKPTELRELGVKERYDLQEWIVSTPQILGEDFLIIQKELELPSGIRLDLLALDRDGRVVVIELKRGHSGKNVDWQAIKYASYVSGFSAEELIKHFAEYLGTNDDDAQDRIEHFVESDLGEVNALQRIVLVAQHFHSDVASAVLWLRDHQVDITCLRVRSFVDGTGDLFVTADVIIPLPEASDYIVKKEARESRVRAGGGISSFSVERGDFDEDELSDRLISSLSRESDLTPRLRAFVEILSSEERAFSREEIKNSFYAQTIGKHLGQSGRYLSNVSQFITKKSNPHLRQVITFEGGDSSGQQKDDYSIVAEYRDLVREVLGQLDDE